MNTYLEKMQTPNQAKTCAYLRVWLQPGESVVERVANTIRSREPSEQTTINGVI